MFLSMGAEWDDAPIVGDGGSTSMSVLARDEELVIERNDVARLSLSAILLIFLQNIEKQHNSWNGIRKTKMLVVSCPKVNHPEVSRPRLPSEYSNQDFGMSSTLILFNFSLDLDSTTTLKFYFSCSNFSSTSLSLCRDLSTTFTPKLLYTLSYSNTTSTKEISTMKFLN